MDKKIFPGNFKSLEPISRFVIKEAQESGFNPSDVYAIQTAVDEACSNIIDHAYGGENVGDIEIRIQKIERGIRITLIDDGVPFDPDDVPEPDITSPLEIRKERGLGIFFMRKLMDRVDFDFSNPNGNALTLEKYKNG